MTNLKDYERFKMENSLESFMAENKVFDMTDSDLDFSHLFFLYTNVEVMELDDIKPFVEFCENIVEIYNMESWNEKIWNGY